MKHYPLIHKFLSMIIVLIYFCAHAQAGQVITDENKQWARQVIQEEKERAAIPSSNSIAVLNFHNQSRNLQLAPLQKGMAVMLITDLAKVEEIQVVERIKMQALLDEIELGVSGLMESQAASRVSKLLEAKYLTSGNIFQGREIGNLEIEPSFLDAMNELSIEQPMVAGAIDELLIIEKTILFNIIKELDVHISPEKEAELKKPLSISIAALLYFFLGVDFSDKGQYSEAEKMYNQALVEDPEFEMAENSLQELNSMTLVSPGETVVGMSTVVKVGLGTAALVAIGAATYYGLDASSSSDSSSSSNGDPTKQSPTVENVAPSEGEHLNCYGGSFTFTFSEPMSPSGEVNILVNNSNLNDFFSRQSWSSNQTFTVSWDHPGNNQYCYNDSYDTESTVIIELLDFLDTAGYALSGIKRFSYTGDYFRKGNVARKATTYR